MNSNGYCPHGGHGPLVTCIKQYGVSLQLSFLFSLYHHITGDDIKLGVEDSQVNIQININPDG